MKTILFNKLSRSPSTQDAKKGNASVLVLLTYDGENDRAALLLTKRTQTVESHKGEVSFPGGYWEVQDANLIETALRETEEEVGIARQRIEVLGSLPKVRTKGCVELEPWVGWVEHPIELNLSVAEVDRVLLLPLARLMKEGLTEHKFSYHGTHITSPGIMVHGELVWGATARVLQMLLDALKS